MPTASTGPLGPFTPASEAPTPEAPGAPAALSAEDLLGTVLEGAKARPARDLSGVTLDRLVVSYGIGPDHIAGERLLAWVPDAPDADTPGALVTTARCLVVTPQRLLNLRYEPIDSASVTLGVQGPTATVRRHGAVVRWSGSASAPIVTALLRGLCAVPPEQRVDQSPLLGGGDEAGAEARGPVTPIEAAAARAQMLCMDDRLDLLLRLVPAASAAGLLSPAAARCALTGISLLERNLFGGRGQRQGEWLTSLLPLELASVLVGVFGDGEATLDRAGLIRMRWVRHQPGDRIPAALRAAIEDVAVRWGPRLGWPPPIGPLRIEAVLSPAPWGSSLSLMAARGGSGPRPLGTLDADELTRVLGWLRDLEPEHLLQRVVLGVDAGPLDPNRRPQLLATARAWLGYVDLDPFFAPSPAAPAHELTNPAARVPARQPLPRPHRLPPVIAASIPVLRQRAAVAQLISGLINLGWVGLLRGALSGGGADDALWAQLRDTLAVLPLALYGLAGVEILAGLLILHQRGMYPGPTWDVSLLQILSLPLGGLPSFVSGLIARALVRRTRFGDAAAPNARARGRHHPSAGVPDGTDATEDEPSTHRARTPADGSDLSPHAQHDAYADDDGNDDDDDRTAAARVRASR